MESANELVKLDDPTGYATHDTYFAARYSQGGRELYSVDLSIPQLIATVPEPDSDRPQEGNRRIDLNHARRFATYVRQNSNWACPALLLRAPHGEFSFELIKPVGGSELGTISVPRLARNSLNIIDGQHRVLGFHIAWRQLAEDLQKARETLAQAKRSEMDKEVVAHAERTVQKLLRERERLAQERIRLEIVIIDDPKEFKQIFVDIADNAKGISRSVSARFDSRKVVNRALIDVLDHPLLEGRVDEQSDRITKSNPNLLGAKHVGDVIRAAQVGVSRRVSRRLEAELDERRVAANARRFLDLLAESFPELRDVRDGTLSPVDLRTRSLLGSAVMLRVLAGAYHDLALVDEPPCSADEVAAFFKTLSGHMVAPIQSDSPWLQTGCFVEGGSAPSARQGDITKLTTHLVEWAQNEPEWLRTASQDART